MFQVCVVKAISEHRQVINLRELEDVSEVGGVSTYVPNVLFKLLILFLKLIDEIFKEI